MDHKAPFLRTTIARLSSLHRLQPKVREQPYTSEAAEAMPESGGASSMPTGKDFDAIARMLLSRCLNGLGLEVHELRDAAWCLWHTDPALSKTPALPAIATAFRGSDDRRTYRNFASALLERFDPVRPGIAEVAEVLAGKASAIGDPWSLLHANFQFFDTRRGPELVAASALASMTSPTEILSDHGLGALEASSGYAKACEAALLSKLATAKKMRALDRLDLVKAVAFNGEGGLNFGDHTPLVANALVLPFGDAMPERNVQDPYLHFLISLLGDPRLHPGAWTRMPQAEAVVRRWLIRSSLLQFFDVVDEVADQGMWKYRHKFWEAVYHRDLISDAWVAFDWKGAGIAKSAFGDELPFAKLKGVLEGQAVLLLRVGRSLVAEWSHNGRCVIWNDVEAAGAPRMCRPAYDAHELRHPGATDNFESPVFAISHTGSANYRWQNKVAAKIYRTTGVSIHSSEYTIR